METNNNLRGLSTAVSLAYKAVIALGYTHQKLVDANPGINFNTLRRIRDGKARKTNSDKYYLKIFISILNKEYNRRIIVDHEGAMTILHLFRILSLTSFNLPLK